MGLRMTATEPGSVTRIGESSEEAIDDGDVVCFDGGCMTQGMEKSMSMLDR